MLGQDFCYKFWVYSVTVSNFTEIQVLLIIFYVWWYIHVNMDRLCDQIQLSKRKHLQVKI